ncbi:hypothetical protein C9417_23660 [Rhizobium sp. SEMIA 4088]|nr:hypothetical protein C9417_23660 [Rhizobium sp. SEMIA 4088]
MHRDDFDIAAAKIFIGIANHVYGYLPTRSPGGNGVVSIPNLILSSYRAAKTAASMLENPASQP